MFDVGFTELLLIFVIGLLILGPERLPRVAAQLGRWVGRARRMANQLRYQLEREIALEEINRAQRPKPGDKPKDEGSENADPASGDAAEGTAEAEASSEAGEGAPGAEPLGDAVAGTARPGEPEGQPGEPEGQPAVKG
jgi:sec-independent protein translocase protein TatB